MSFSVFFSHISYFPSTCFSFLLNFLFFFFLAFFMFSPNATHSHSHLLHCYYFALLYCHKTINSMNHNKNIPIVFRTLYLVTMYQMKKEKFIRNVVSETFLFILSIHFIIILHQVNWKCDAVSYWNSCTWVSNYFF